MALILKSRPQIALLQAAGKLVADTFSMLERHVRPGVTTAELDAIAEDYIRSHNAEPVFKGYRGARGRQGARNPFPGSICASVNDVICHGIPSQTVRLRQGDIISIDVGLRLNGWIGDACMTYAVGKIDARSQRLLDVTHQALMIGIEQARIGNTLGDIGAAIQSHAEGHGFTVVREYTGHGIGRNLHEEPTVLHYGEPGKGRRLVSGMVFTIEPMVNIGTAETRLDPDQWTVRTADGQRSAQFEHAIVITDSGPLILSQ